MAIFSQVSEACSFSGSMAFVNTAENAAGRPGAVHPTHKPKPREKCRCDRQLRQANHMTIEYLLCFRLARRYLSKTMQTLRISRRPFGVTVIQLSSSVIGPLSSKGLGSSSSVAKWRSNSIRWDASMASVDNSN
jgi:hypothetical protein